jgi:hypothetical protein
MQRTPDGGEPHRIVRGLDAFSATDIWSGIGALQLIPENADQGYRLHRLAGAVLTLGSTPDGDRPKMSLARWRRLVNSPPVADPHTKLMEDPYEEVWTESVAFFGGDYLVLNGLEMNSAQTLRHLTQAIFQQDRVWPYSFTLESERLIRSVLALSNHVCGRGGLRRGAVPADRWRQDVSVPPRSTLPGSATSCCGAPRRVGVARWGGRRGEP